MLDYLFGDTPAQCFLRDAVCWWVRTHVSEAELPPRHKLSWLDETLGAVSYPPITGLFSHYLPEAARRSVPLAAKKLEAILGVSEMRPPVDHSLYTVAANYLLRAYEDSLAFADVPAIVAKTATQESA